MLCILTSALVLLAPANWLKYFFELFLIPFLHMLRYVMICIYHISFSLKLIDMQTQVNSLRGYPPTFIFFRSIKKKTFLSFFLDFRQKITEKCFGCLQHPEAGRNTQYIAVSRSFMLKMPLL